LICQFVRFEKSGRKSNKKTNGGAFSLIPGQLDFRAF